MYGLESMQLPMIALERLVTCRLKEVRQLMNMGTSYANGKHHLKLVYSGMVAMRFTDWETLHVEV